ncbi:MAG: hypothetical protein ACKO26_23895 [Planctomycetota bacterium]
MMMVVLLAASAALAQQPPGQVVKLDLPARAIESPVLRHRILPQLEEITTGNAAVHYATAFAPDSISFTRAEKDFSDRLQKWLTCPLPELAAVKSPILEDRFFPLAELERGARKSHCDWQMKDRLKDGIGTLLPDLQGFRMLANFMRVRARWHLANNRPEEALRDVRTILVFGRHVSEGPTLIQYLVGVAVCHVGFTTLHDYMAHADGANLFWSLAYTPHRFLPFINALEGERIFIGAEFPGLERDKPVTQEKAAELSRRFDKLMGLVSEGSGEGPSKVMPFLGVASYTDSKAYLAEKLKLDPQVVARMPVAQVVLIRQLDEYERARDELFKAALLPVPQAVAVMREVDARLKAPALSQGPNALMRNLLPAIDRVTLAHHRADRTIGALMVIEALRHHVAKAGKLPERLEETGLPLPVDPYTLKPFRYTRLKDAECTVEVVPPEGGKPNPADFIRYEATIRPRISKE